MSEQAKQREDRLTQRIESMHVEREVRDNRQEVDVLRLLDMIDGLLVVAKALGGPAKRIDAALKALRGSGSSNCGSAEVEAILRNSGRSDGYARCQADVASWLRFELSMGQVADDVEAGAHVDAAELFGGASERAQPTGREG